eukprot:1780749-Rhodomonas_salina.2
MEDASSTLGVTSLMLPPVLSHAINPGPPNLFSISLHCSSERDLCSVGACYFCVFSSTYSQPLRSLKVSGAMAASSGWHPPDAHQTTDTTTTVTTVTTVTTTNISVAITTPAIATDALTHLFTILLRLNAAPQPGTRHGRLRTSSSSFPKSGVPAPVTCPTTLQPQSQTPPRSQLARCFAQAACSPGPSQPAPRNPTSHTPGYGRRSRR